MTGLRSAARRAFTIVELLVVIAIIGILIALLVPAVQAAREAARKTQCTSNLKQLAIALHNYHDAHHFFPPSVQFDYGQDPGASDYYRANWVILILPFLEEQPTYDQFNLTLPISDPSNSNARGTRVATMLCPTDIGADVPFAGTGANEGGNWARGNYGANATNAQLHLDGTVYNAASPSTYPACDCGAFGLTASQKEGWVRLDRRGVMGACVSMSLPKISDGASHTMLLGELRIGVTLHDRRGTWAMGVAGASALYQHGFGLAANGPNSCWGTSDGVRGCEIITNELGGPGPGGPGLGGPGEAALMAMCMDCWIAWSDEAASRSRHTPGGVNTVFCDGSVHFVSDEIFTGGNYAPTPGPWDALITCCNGTAASPQEYEVE